MLKEYLKNIADAIRLKLGGADKVNAQDFADKVNEVYDKGYDGGTYNEAYQLLTRNFTNPYRVPYGLNALSNSVFCYCWGTDLEIIIPETIKMMANSVFGSCYRLAKVNVPPNLTTFGVNMFSSCEQLKTIVFNNVQEFMVMKAAMTSGCKVLANIVIENGVIAQDWQFPASPLSVASMKSIILHLKNFTGTDSEATKTLTFTGACWTNLEASTSPYEDGLTDDENLTWTEYVQNLGWLTV